MLSAEPRFLAGWLEASGDERHFFAREGTVEFSALARGSALGDDRSKLQNRSVLVATRSQLTAALTLLELDGLARRLVLLPPDVSSAQLPAVIANAEIDAVVIDGETDQALRSLPLRVTCKPTILPTPDPHFQRQQTEWLLFTSGTVGVPKMVSHSLESLTAPIKRRTSHNSPIVWATFYDIRRYGGLQIFLRAIIDGGAFILSDAKELVGDFLTRLGGHGVTRISGTPSHWRQALMSPSAQAMSPAYVRLSGEIADQTILDRLAACYPQANIGHAYASTEAGVGFEVDDGREGFPVNFIDRTDGDVEMKVVDGSLRVRSRRTASRYYGSNAALADEAGFIDTGDMLEQRGDRYYFVGRRGGIINVGGLKVHPEEIEAVINRHPQVRMSLVRPKKSPVTGAIVVADVVLESGSKNTGTEQKIRNAIFDLCRRALPRHKVPVAITFVPALDVAVTGKIARRNG
jgi:acyl-coenzyme A synthetase/AMP-(fatty) acid ligase